MTRKEDQPPALVAPVQRASLRQSDFVGGNYNCLVNQRFGDLSKLKMGNKTAKPLPAPTRFGAFPLHPAQILFSF